MKNLSLLLIFFASISFAQSSVEKDKKIIDKEEVVFLTVTEPLLNNEYDISNAFRFKAYNSPYTDKVLNKEAVVGYNGFITVLDAYKYRCKTKDCMMSTIDILSRDKYIVEFKFKNSNDTLFFKGYDFDFINKSNFFSKEMNDIIFSAKKNIIKDNENEKWLITKNTCHYDINNIDEFNGDKKIRTRNYSLYNAESEYGMLSIQLVRINNKKYVNFMSNSDLGCTSPNSSNKSFVSVKLENGDIIKFYHKGRLDCGTFDLTGGLSESEIIRLKKSPIKIIRLTGTDSYNDYNDITWKMFFIDKLNCIK